MNNSLRILCAFILLLGAYACKSKKKLAAPKEVVSQTTETKDEKITAKSMLQAIYTPWQYFSGKAEMDFKSKDMSATVTANIRMYKDSLVWMSVNYFGLEVARILINKDSIVLLNKAKREYYVYKAEQATQLIGAPLSVSQIQNLLLAKPLFPLEQYNITINDEHILKILNNTNPRFSVEHKIQKKFLTIDSTNVSESNSTNYANAFYSKYSNVNNQNFPFVTNITANTSKTGIASVALNYEKADFVTPVSFSFSIPSSYERKN